MHDKWMLSMCIRLSKNNAWAIDSTFKTNVFGLPLYAAVAPNEHGVGIPLWYMLCTNDTGSQHEQLALEMTLKIIFEKMEGVRPKALVIDKSWTEYIALKNVIEVDSGCWEIVNGKRQQTSCLIFLCWFHVKKAWVEHLLPKVHGMERDKLYDHMCRLMYCSKEEEFNQVYGSILEVYKEHKNVCLYIKNCWCNDTWKKTWPKFGRMFSYGHVDTTNIVERHWQYIKYTAFKGRINRPITDLVHALIGDSVTGSWMGGIVLEWFKQKQEISDSGRFLPRANCKDEANRMREAEKIIERYVANPTTIQVMDETRLYFRVLSMSKEDTWYNVYFQASFCDCDDYAFKCKHLMCIRLFIEQHMPDSRKELHLIDDALEMRGQDANANFEGGHDESIFATISLVKETMRNFEECLHSMSKEDVNVWNERMLAFCHQMRYDISHLMKDLPQNESIRGLQQNVIENPYGNKRPIVSNVVPFEDIGVAPNNKDKGTRRHGWGIQGCRKRVRLPRRMKVRCMHCNSLVLILDKNQTSHCNHCDSMLPLNHNHGDISIAMKALKGKCILIDDGAECITSAMIVDLHYPDNGGERWFTITNSNGVSTTNIYASKVRILAT